MKAGVKKKQLTVVQRWLYYVVVCFGGGAALGAIGAFFAGFFSVKEIAAMVNADNILWVTRAFLAVVLLIGLWFLAEARGGYKAYEASETEDDETVDKLYSMMFRSLEYATIAFNVMGSLTLLNIILSFNFIIESDGASLTASMIDFGAFILLAILQVVLMKTTQKIRNYKLSAFPTAREIKDYVNSYDEGERQANFENSFVTMFNLNQYVLPALYILVMFVSMISQTKQILALVIVAFIHIYINLAQITGIRQYFK